MIVLGLTGSIGMGKSRVAAMFRDEGVPVFDADAEVHRLQGPGGALVAAIEEAFPGTTGPAGVDRQKLGPKVFGKPAELKRLEAIVHPAVHASRCNFLRRHRFKPLVVVDVPLLFEAGGWKQVDRIAVVSAPLRVQRRRVLSRPGMTLAKFESILKLQLPDREKRRRADFIIPTGGALPRTRAAVSAVVKALEKPGLCIRRRHRRPRSSQPQGKPKG